MLGGTHVMVDLYGASDPGEDTSRVLMDAAKLADLKVLEGVEHIFPSGGYGRTTMLVLSESHTSVHTWPENRYVAFDLFSCRDLTKDQVKKVTDYMKKVTGARSARVNIQERKHGMSGLGAYVPAHQQALTSIGPSMFSRPRRGPRPVRDRAFVRRWPSTPTVVIERTVTRGPQPGYIQAPPLEPEYQAEIPPLSGLGQIPRDMVGPLLIAAAIVAAPAIGVITAWLLKKAGIRA